MAWNLTLGIHAYKLEDPQVSGRSGAAAALHTDILRLPQMLRILHEINFSDQALQNMFIG